MNGENGVSLISDDNTQCDEFCLRYNGMSLIFFQIFTCMKECGECKECRVDEAFRQSGHIKQKSPKEVIDRQVFVYNMNINPIKRYNLNGFTFSLSLPDPCPDDAPCKHGAPCSLKEGGNPDLEPCQWSISGNIQVEMSTFYNKTISLTYRIVIDDSEADESEKYGFIKTSGSLTTDHLISLVSLVVDVEHWGVAEVQCDKCGSTDFTEQPEKNITAEDGEVLLCYRCNNDSCNNTFFRDFSYGNISPEIEGFTIGGLFLDSDGNWSEDTAKNQESLVSDYEENKLSRPNHTLFKEVLSRYKKHIFNIRESAGCRGDCGVWTPNDDSEDNTYAYVDIWESFQVNGERVQADKEAEFISHVFKKHKRELIGLMTLYPYEWLQRAPVAFSDVCGGDIALDVDDLVLANQQLCVIFGTYGIRGDDAATNWARHLRIRKIFHCSWPDYMIILEMLLVQRHTIKCAEGILLESALSKTASGDPIKSVEDNAKMHLEIVKMLSNLDAVRYLRFVSHKTMFDRTQKRLRVEEERKKLEDTMERINNSLNNIRDIQSLRQNEKAIEQNKESLKRSRILNFVLGIVSISSLFQLIFMNTEFPLLHFFDQSYHEIVAVVFILIFIGLVIISAIYTVMDFMDAGRDDDDTKPEGKKKKPPRGGKKQRKARKGQQDG